MSVEVWFRNPHDYIRELVEVGQTNITWDRGLLVKRHIDPLKHAELYFGQTYPDWRILTVGSQGSAEYRQGSTIDQPVAVYPTWEYGEDSTVLEEMLASPLGEDVESCSDMSVSGDERPVWGQEHRVIVASLPMITSGAGRTFLRYLKGLQEEYPQAMIHLHGLYSWRVMFGMGFAAADVEPRSAAAKGKVHTPSGKVELYERLVQHPQWAAAMGFKPADLEIPRNRCIYNIKSALWAGQYYEEMYKFRVRGSNKEDVDYESSDEEFTPDETASHMTSPVKVAEGDQFICDTCSLQDKCKYYRSGSVCTVPGAEPVRLATMFKSRNVDDILDGLSSIAAAGAARLERGIRNEAIDGDISPEVSKMMGQVFDQGVKLARLHDPARFSPKQGGVTVNVGGNGAVALEGGNPRQLVAQVVQGFVNQGFARSEITQDMVRGALEGMVDPDKQTKQITGTVISEEKEA